MNVDSQYEWVLVTGTGTWRDGEVYRRDKLPVGVRPDRFGLVAYRPTGEVRVIEGVTVEVVQAH